MVPLSQSSQRDDDAYDETCDEAPSPARAPGTRWRPTPDEFRFILDEHAKWLATEGREGAQADFENADLTGEDLGFCNLPKAVFTNADLTGVNFLGAHLEEAIFRRAIMPGAHLRLARLECAIFQDADLSGARLQMSRLDGANLAGAKCSGASLYGACLVGTNLNETRFDSADLRLTRGVRLDQCFVRGTQFSPVGMRWWAFFCNNVFPRLVRMCENRDWNRLANRLRFSKKYNDPWSVLRQSYAGPKLFFLFLFVIAFALPYVGRVAFYSAFGPVERRLAPHAESWKHELEAQLLVKVEPRPVWQVLLKWDEGKVWPTVLAVLLILYNGGLYFLISSVSPLRDEEERSGWSPAWADYARLIWVHRVVTGLFYVSFISFLVNAGQLLTDVVFVVKPG